MNKRLVIQQVTTAASQSTLAFTAKALISQKPLAKIYRQLFAMNSFCLWMKALVSMTLNDVPTRSFPCIA